MVSGEGSGGVRRSRGNRDLIKGTSGSTLPLLQVRTQRGDPSAPDTEAAGALTNCGRLAPRAQKKKSLLLQQLCLWPWVVVGGGLVAQSCPTLATPWTVARQAPLVCGLGW